MKITNQAIPALSTSVQFALLTLLLGFMPIQPGFASKTDILSDSNITQPVERISEEPLTLDIHFHYHKGFAYDNNWPVEKKASAVTGISLNNVTAIVSDNTNEAFNVLMANGDLPDIVGGSNLRNNVNKFGPKGHFLSLNDLIEQHAPNIQAFFSKNPDILNAISASDGKLYHIPYVPDGKFGRAYFIRQDWLNTLGLAIPNTVDELYEVLTAFKNKDPNKNKLADEVPFFARNTSEMVRLVTLWDARTSGTDTTHDFYLKNNEIRHGYTEDNYRKGIENLSKWFAEGLIDQDIFDRKNNARTELLNANRGGMTHDWFASTSSFNSSLSDSVEGFEFKPFAPPESVSGKRIEEHRRVSVKPDGWAITSTNQSVVETIKYFDFWFSPYGRRLANFGIEGSEYTLQNGAPVFKDELLNADQPMNKLLWTIGAQIPRGFVQDYEYEKQWTNKIALDGIELYEKGNFLLEPFHGVTLNEEEKETFDYYWNEILAFMLERQEEWLLGLRDVNQDWDSYKKRLDKLGIEKVLAVMQTAYNRQYGINRTADLQEK